jgi:hypothetical protein
MAFRTTRAVTSGAVGLGAGVLGPTLGTITTGVVGVVGVVASTSRAVPIAEDIADGMTDGAAAILGREFAGLSVLAGVIGLLSLGVLVVIDEASKHPVAL